MTSTVVGEDIDNSVYLLNKVKISDQFCKLHNKEVGKKLKDFMEH